jgi:hypothetical protein
MSWVAVAIGGSALIGAGGSIMGGLTQSGAAKDAAATQADAYRQGITTTQQAGRDALAYLDPYRQFGLNAGNTIEAMLYSPDQRIAQMEQGRLAAQAEVDRLKSLVPDWDRYPVFTGKNASERRAQAFMEERNTALTKVAEAEAKLKSFDQQAALFQKQTQAGTFEPRKIEESPWYAFQAELLGRNMDRFFAARGLTGSGFEAEERRRGLLELGAGETERQYSRMAGLFGTGANAALAGAGVLTGTAQNVAGMQVGQGNAIANGLLRVGEANAGMAAGISNQLNSAAGLYLQNQQWNAFRDTLANRNNPSSYGSDPVFNSVDSGGGSYGYLRPTGGAV